MDHLIDIFCHVPGIMEDLQTIASHTIVMDESLISYIILGFQIKALFERLYDWRAKWETDCSDTYFSIGLDTLKELNLVELDFYPFPIAIFFNEHVRVTELCLYNATLIILRQSCQRLPASVISTLALNGNTSSWLRPSILLAPGDGSVVDIIGEFCKLVYYQLLSYPGTSGAVQIMFPLQVAYRNINSCSQEAQWLHKIICHIADGCGFDAVRYYEGFGNIQNID